MTLLFFVLVSAGAWQSHGVVEGITIETRPISGSSYESIRVSKQTTVPPEVQADAIWGTSGMESVANKAVHEHRVLEETPTKRVLYEVVSAPLISDRDYVLAVERRRDGELFEVLFHTLEHPQYPPQDGKVRMRINGSCVIEPDGAGGSIVTYELFADIGGTLPAWIARGAQRDSSIEWLKVMLARGEKRNRTK